MKSGAEKRRCGHGLFRDDREERDSLQTEPREIY